MSKNNYIFFGFLVLLLAGMENVKANDYQKLLPQNLQQRITPYLKESQEYFGIDQDVEEMLRKDIEKPKLLIFISSSMPKEMLKQYAVAARQAEGALVLRGFINNDLRKTISFIKSLHDKGVAAFISPHGFKQMSVKHVPAIAVIAKNTGCYLSDCDRTPLYDKISGSVTLSYALRRIVTDGENTQKEARKFLKKLEGRSG